MLSIIPTLFPKAPGTWLGKKKFRNDFDASDSNTDDDNSRFVAKKTKLASKKSSNQSKKFKKTSVTKNKARSQTLSPDPIMRANKEVVRKRRPINFTVDDLDDDKDESFTRNDFDTSDSNSDDEEFKFLSKSAKMSTAQLNAVTYKNQANQAGEPSGRKRKIVNYKDFEFEKNDTDEDF